MDNRVRLLGVRGSVSVSGPEHVRYGGATTCVLVTLGGQTVVLDAGSGLMRLPEDVMAPDRLSLILTHTHADHLMGLPLCPYVMRAGRTLDIYGAERSGFTLEEELARLISPPLWPVHLDELPAKTVLHVLPERLELGSVTVTMQDGCHPGGVSVLRLEGGGRSVVLMTDCTVTEDNRERLASFAAGCDLLPIAGQYSAEEWECRSDYGHNAWPAAAQFGLYCGARQTLIVHHDPFRTDDELDAAAPELAQVNPDARFAREGAEVAL